MPRWSLAGWIAFAVAPYAAMPWLGGEASKPDFNRDVLIPLKARCGSCHGGAQPTADLDLTTAAGIAKGGSSGKLAVAGKPNESLLIQRLRGEGGKPQMPLGFAPLTQDEIAKIEAWIEAGADASHVAPPHWSYIPPKRPELPDARNPGWVKNPIDRFILARIEKEGLKPSPEADREALIRRVSLDLIGLPPTLAEIDAFLADKSADAYERVVDRLLASPHYGERQARIWLDLARYADSDGYEADFRRVAWKYRDWVIDAFNRNMPYSEFTVEQIAGDLLPQASIDQQVATGFHRNTMFNREGGIDPGEAHFNVLVDRVGTTGTVWLGATLACARCHDHKYDPLSQKDFYKMMAFYSNTEYTPSGDANVGAEKWYEPSIEAPSEAQAKARDDAKRQIEAIQAAMSREVERLKPERDEWAGLVAKPVAWVNPVPALGSDQPAVTFSTDATGVVLVAGENPDRVNYTWKSKVESEVRGIMLEALPEKSFKAGGPGRSESGNFILSGLRVRVGGKPVAMARANANFVQDGYEIGGVFDDNPNTGWAVYPVSAPGRKAVFEPRDPIPGGSEIDVTLEFQSPVFPRHALGKFRISLTSEKYPSRTVMPADIAAIAKREKKFSGDDEKLAKYFLAIAPSLQPLRDRLSAAQTALGKVQAAIPTAMVLREKPSQGPIKTNVHVRGEFLSKGEEVQAGTPDALAAMKPSMPANRLGLAQWLVDRDNPLTARVQVNRMWESVFGVGIVETSDDFGTQGSLPTHPELLDWLAVEFMDRGWDMKAMLRLIVTSATYRQSSKATEEGIAKDPDNRLLARGPRFRLEAEAIRDAALTASGLLDPKVGGPSVFPQQPAGIWDSPYNGDQWMTDKDTNRYRRGIYTFIKRTAPYPSFMAFDATSRESCTVRRVRTNTPLQALALLNDEAYLDAARALGKRMAAGAKSDADRLVIGFRLAAGRRPNREESARLEKLLGQMRARFTKDADAAKKVAEDPEAAAWTMVANVLLNLDETITKR